MILDPKRVEAVFKKLKISEAKQAKLLKAMEDAVSMRPIKVVSLSLAPPNPAMASQFGGYNNWKGYLKVSFGIPYGAGGYIEAGFIPYSLSLEDIDGTPFLSARPDTGSSRTPKFNSTLRGLNLIAGVALLANRYYSRLETAAFARNGKPHAFMRLEDTYLQFNTDTRAWNLVEGGKVVA